MRRIYQLSFGLALLFALSVGAAETFAKSGAKRRVISGVVTSIQRDERTFTLREFATDKQYRVQAPAGVTFRDNLSGSLISYEQLLPGRVVRDMTVE
jgi:hypothetical protein